MKRAGGDVRGGIEPLVNHEPRTTLGYPKKLAPFRTSLLCMLCNDCCSGVQIYAFSLHICILRYSCALLDRCPDVLMLNAANLCSTLHYWTLLCSTLYLTAHHRTALHCTVLARRGYSTSIETYGLVHLIPEHARPFSMPSRDNPLRSYCD